MDGFTVLLLGLGAVVLLIAVVTGLGLLRGPRGLYVRNDTLLSEEEGDLLRALERCAGDEFRVLAKVGVYGLVRPRKRLPRKARRYASDRIVGDLFDYVLVDRMSLRPVSALLVERSGAPRRQRRHYAFLTRLCTAVGLPLVLIDPVAATDPQYLCRMIEEAARTPDTGAGGDASRAEPRLPGTDAGG